jgi:hypothetical protein
MDFNERAKTISARYLADPESTGLGPSMQEMMDFLRELTELSVHFTSLLETGELVGENEEAAFALLRSAYGADLLIGNIHRGNPKLYPPLEKLHRTAADLARHVLRKRGKLDMLSNFLRMYFPDEARELDKELGVR